ncbi:Solute-binding protein [subsurface metagenome]
MFQGVIDGIADIGYSHVYYTPGRMPVTEVVGLPLAYPSAWVSGQVLNDFYEEFKPAEWDDVKVLWMNTSTPSGIATADTPVRTLEDLEGLTIRAPGLCGEIIAALGATPVPTPMPEVYEAISKGEIDGEQSNFETLFAFKFAEVVKYETSIWQISFPYPFYVVMNEDSYNNLPDDIRAIFDTLVGEYKERSLLMWNSVDFLGQAAGLAAGVEFIELSEAEVAKFKAAVAPVIDDYIADMVAAGYSQAEVEGWIEFLRERSDYWMAKQIEFHIMSAAGHPDVTE